MTTKLFGSKQDVQRKFGFERKTAKYLRCAKSLVINFQKVKEIEFGEPLEAQIGINVKNNNRKLAQEMELSEIEGTDFYEFFLKVKQLYKS